MHATSCICTAATAGEARRRTQRRGGSPMALDEATAKLLAEMAASGMKPLHEMTPEEARGLGGMLCEMYGPGPDVARVTEASIPTPDGASIGARIIVPNDSPTAVMVYLHGGGWVIGALDEFDTLGRQMAQRTG